jgi:SWIM zinc finger
MSPLGTSVPPVSRPSAEEVKGLAPDASGLKAALALAVPEPWSGAGYDERGVWGACRGSAKAPYQVICDTAGPAYSCTCPSRKFPCKHALALLLLWAGASPAVPPGAPPPDTAAWLAGRQLKNNGSGGIAAAGAKRSPEVADGTEVGAPAGARAKVADPEAAAARVVERTRKIVAGMAELDRWLGDLVRHGFGQAQAQPYRFWDAMAARLVDAQAPAAAARVRRLPGLVRSGDGWPGRLLSQVARLHLLAAGWARYEQLPAESRADLRTAAGWPWPSAEVLAGPHESDQWYVIARSVTEDEQVRAQRTWLWGLTSAKLAVVVDFARPGAAFAWELWPGNCIGAEVARFPGSFPLRVLVAERGSAAVPAGPPPGWGSFDEAAAARSSAVSKDPWLERWPLSVKAVTPHYSQGQWSIVDRDGGSLPLLVAAPASWQLLALSAGRPVQLAGEWDEDGVVPLTIWADEGLVVL